MAVTQLVVNLGHGLRERTNQRFRQPLAELRFATNDAKQRAALESLAKVMQEELNVKKIAACDQLVSCLYKANLKTRGPKCSKRLGVINKARTPIDPQLVAPLRRGEAVTLHLDGTDYLLQPEGLDGNPLHGRGFVHFKLPAPKKGQRDQSPRSPRVTHSTRLILAPKIKQF